MHIPTHRCSKLIRSAWFTLCLLGWAVVLTIWSGAPLRAQSCTGGPPELAVDESFGRLGSPASLSNRTRYQLTTVACPLDGQYSLTDHVDGSCYNTLWHTISQDHTPGETGGLMMVVNGAPGAGEVFSQPATGLCGQTTYEFSLWGINLLRPGICTDPILPNLTLRVEAADGTVLQNIDFGSIPLSATPVWNRFATLFTTPASTEGVIIKLINNQGDLGCGNDMAIDDVQVKQCTSCPAMPVFVPDVFTPNGDGTNDVLGVFLTGATAFTMTVYDRWGSPVFYSNSLDQRWDGTDKGTPCLAGTYTWLLTYRQTGADPNDKPIVHRGQVVLAR
ncbi:gliding motility-associated C-terminal domain-containing protein [uncultured Spirosoma sp.]|uniref:gliding motility-associated C-terminal domain-containing protein n=1 Tax=uncultured Spirosoma sp. TaxID=278208 RepID=UPI00258DFEB1|nr:gliding motility-associated C-terminal domain-containing protein [uncultured Spirosoma sp.]